MLVPPPRSPLFPYTTLFRSRRPAAGQTPAEHQSDVGRGTGAHRDRPVVRDLSGQALALLSARRGRRTARDRKSTRLNSSHLGISYAVFCLKKKTTKQMKNTR